MSYPARHAHPDPETLAECILIDATLANWLVARNQADDDVLDMATVRDAWRAGWVEGVIRERYRPRLAARPPD